MSRWRKLKSRDTEKKKSDVGTSDHVALAQVSGDKWSEKGVCSHEGREEPLTDVMEKRLSTDGDVQSVKSEGASPHGRKRGAGTPLDWGFRFRLRQKPQSQAHNGPSFLQIHLLASLCRTFSPPSAPSTPSCHLPSSNITFNAGDRQVKARHGYRLANIRATSCSCLQGTRTCCTPWLLGTEQRPLEQRH